MMFGQKLAMPTILPARPTCALLHVFFATAQCLCAFSGIDFKSNRIHLILYSKVDSIPRKYEVNKYLI